MTKLSTTLVHDRLLTESEATKISYDTMKSPDGKTKKVDAKKDPSGKMTKITQVEVPSTHKNPKTKASSKGGAGGIPTADFAGNIIDAQTKHTFGKTVTKSAKSPATPAVKKTVPNQQQKQKEITGAIKRTEAGKGPKADTIPSADTASAYTKKMPHGGTNMKSSGNGTPEVKAPTANNLNGTTRTSYSPAKMKTRDVGTQHVTQVSHTGGKAKEPSDAPAKPTWNKAIKGHNVMESVQVMINGKRKASFGLINRDIAAKLVESYESHGFDVKLVRGAAPAWKSDKALIKTIFEAVDAHYNNAPRTSATKRKDAMSKFFHLSSGDYNNMYESRQQFAQTVKAAFERVMERADASYRKKLDVIEGIARVEVNGEVIDVDLITQARDADMALRNFRNEIVGEFGFNSKIRHIFVEGQKFGTQDIKEWSSK